MKYTIEDTPDGFLLSVEADGGRVLTTIAEPGGHGPLEALYSQAIETYAPLRRKTIAADRAQAMRAAAS